MGKVPSGLVRALRGLKEERRRDVLVDLLLSPDGAWKGLARTITQLSGKTWPQELLHTLLTQFMCIWDTGLHFHGPRSRPKGTPVLRNGAQQAGGRGPDRAGPAAWPPSPHGHVAGAEGLPALRAGELPPPGEFVRTQAVLRLHEVPANGPVPVLQVPGLLGASDAQGFMCACSLVAVLAARTCATSKTRKLSMWLRVLLGLMR
ncbi:hypothetical protein WJX74_003578 [Apatococcus lobatus]|uniref:Uncharacterized protein n=1 Tax=Apatococcus lobatus TaxID=904363 RepID=A0AAW1QZP7_9CHLO